MVGTSVGEDERLMDSEFEMDLGLLNPEVTAASELVAKCLGSPTSDAFLAKSLPSWRVDNDGLHCFDVE